MNCKLRCACYTNSISTVLSSRRYLTNAKHEFSTVASDEQRERACVGLYNMHKSKKENLSFAIT